MEYLANQYASQGIAIPYFVEQAIATLPRHRLLDFADDLIRSIRDRQWSSRKDNPTLTGDPDEWLDNQGVETFKSLLRWISMELI